LESNSTKEPMLLEEEIVSEDIENQGSPLKITKNVKKKPKQSEEKLDSKALKVHH